MVNLALINLKIRIPVNKPTHQTQRPSNSNSSERKCSLVTYNKRTDTYEVEDLGNLSGEDLAEIWDLSGGGSGYFVPKDIVPDLEQYLAEGNPYCWFEGLVSEDRLKELEAGKRPKRPEIRAYQKSWIEKALRGNNDADLVPTYQTVEIKGRKGRKKVAIIMCSGYSFSGVSFWVEGLFSSYERADNYLTRKGYVD